MGDLHTHRDTWHPPVFLEGTASGTAPKERLPLATRTEMKEEGLCRRAPVSAEKQIDNKKLETVS